MVYKGALDGCFGDIDVFHRENQLKGWFFISMLTTSCDLDDAGHLTYFCCILSFVLFFLIPYLFLQVRFTRAEAPRSISELPGYVIQVPSS